MKDRITGNAISGVSITFTGRETKTATIVAGNFQVEGGLLPGIYTARIDSRLMHVEEALNINAGPNKLQTSVLLFGSVSQDGVVLDDRVSRFDDLFLRRGGQSTPSPEGKVRKWDLNSPSGIRPRAFYVTEETGNDRLSDAGMQNLMQMLQELNMENMSGYTADLLGPIAIEKGPPVGDFRTGYIVVRTWDKRFSGGNANGFDGYTTSGFVSMDIDLFEPATFNIVWAKRALAHEIAHAFGSNHPVNDYAMEGLPSLMGTNDQNGSRLSIYDRSAFRIMYHPDTQWGNWGDPTQDINPNAFGGSRSSASSSGGGQSRATFDHFDPTPVFRRAL